MTKLIAGILIGMCATALAQDALELGRNNNFVLSGGYGTDGLAHPIQLDARGYVICSAEKPKP